MRTIQEILQQYESGLLSLEETWNKLFEETAKERLALLLFRKLLKDFKNKSPMAIAEDLIYVLETSKKGW